MRLGRAILLLLAIVAALVVLSPRTAESTTKCHNAELLGEVMSLELIDVRIDGQAVALSTLTRSDAGYSLANDSQFSQVTARLWDPDSLTGEREGTLPWESQ